MGKDERANIKRSRMMKYFIDAANEIIKKEGISFSPPQQQKCLFKQWIGVGRKVYNTCVNHFNEKNIVFKGWMQMSTVVLAELTEDYVFQTDVYDKLLSPQYHVPPFLF